MPEVSLPDRVRDACAWVAARSRSVRIDEEAIPAYAAALPRESEAVGRQLEPADREAAAAFAICMDAINFGSGWWPTIRKRPGHSGYETIAAGLRERFAAGGPWTAEELTTVDTTAIAAVLGQDPEHPLMSQFTAALRDVGAHLLADHGGHYMGWWGRIGRLPAWPARSLAGRPLPMSPYIESARSPSTSARS
jgi:hypothetical protein